MKKLTSKLLVLVMVLAMAFSLSACGGDDSKVSTTDQGTTNEGTTNESTTNESSQSDSGSDKKSDGYSSLEDYVNSDEVQSAFSTLEKSLSGSGMSIKISAKDNMMIYTYTYDKTEKSDVLAEQLEKAMETQDATFQATADGIKKEVDVDSAIVRIEYIDCNGEEIYSKEYTAE